MDEVAVDIDRPTTYLLVDGTRLEGYELYRPGRFGTRAMVYFEERWRPANIVLSTASPEISAMCKNASMAGRFESGVFLSGVAADAWCVDGQYIQILNEFPDCRSVCAEDFDKDAAVAVSKVISDLLQSLRYLHSMGFVHASIYPGAIVTDGTNFSLSEFWFVHDMRGVAFYPELHEFYPGCLGVDAMLFCAPELYLGSPPGAVGDIYSLGSSLFYLLTGRNNIKRDTTCDYREVFSQTIEAKCPWLDEQCRAALALMLVENPEHRSSVDFLLEILSPLNNVTI